METSEKIDLSLSNLALEQGEKISSFEKIIRLYNKIYLVVSPPRCSSTAFARVFWEHPSIGYYSHEPFDVTYHEKMDLNHVINKLEIPFDLKDIKKHANSEIGVGLIIKEMSFQVGKHFPLLAALTQEPIIFLVRDPRLNISSRMEKQKQGGNNPLFPLIESGWEFILTQIEYTQQQNIPYCIVDATDFRNNPQVIFQQVFEELKLSFDREMLSWQSCKNDVQIDNLDGQQTHFYDRVLMSTNIQPATEPIPSIDSFPTAGGFREHVLKCLDIYKYLCSLPQRITLDNHL